MKIMKGLITACFLTLLFFGMTYGQEPCEGYVNIISIDKDRSQFGFCTPISLDRDIAEYQVWRYTSTTALADEGELFDFINADQCDDLDCRTGRHDAIENGTWYFRTRYKTTDGQTGDYSDGYVTLEVEEKPPSKGGGCSIRMF